MSNAVQKSVVQRFTAWATSKEAVSYFCSTHFWGPVANWGLPLAAIADSRKDPEMISGKMTLAMMVYSGIFMRFAWRVQPRNYLLLACHVTNEAVQTYQMARFVTHFHSDSLPAVAATKPESKPSTTSSSSSSSSHK